MAWDYFVSWTHCFSSQLENSNYRSSIFWHFYFVWGVGDVCLSNFFICSTSSLCSYLLVSSSSLLIFLSSSLSLLFPLYLFFFSPIPPFLSSSLLALFIYSSIFFSLIFILLFSPPFTLILPLFGMDCPSIQRIGNKIDKTWDRRLGEHLIVNYRSKRRHGAGLVVWILSRCRFDSWRPATEDYENTGSVEANRSGSLGDISLAHHLCVTEKLSSGSCLSDPWADWNPWKSNWKITRELERMKQRAFAIERSIPAQELGRPVSR